MEVTWRRHGGREMEVAWWQVEGGDMGVAWKSHEGTWEYGLKVTWR